MRPTYTPTTFSFLSGTPTFQPVCIEVQAKFNASAWCALTFCFLRWQASSYFIYHVPTTLYWLLAGVEHLTKLNHTFLCVFSSRCATACPETDVTLPLLFMLTQTYLEIRISQENCNRWIQKSGQIEDLSECRQRLSNKWRPALHFMNCSDRGRRMVGDGDLSSEGWDVVEGYLNARRPAATRLFTYDVHIYLIIRSGFKTVTTTFCNQVWSGLGDFNI